MPRLVVFLSWILALLVTSVAAQRIPLPSEPGCTVSGTVTITVSDVSGARIPNAFVLFRANRLGDHNAKKVPVELWTNSAGIATGSLPCGYSDLFVGADGFTPQARELLIEQNTSSLSVRLEVYPQTEQ